ncbi:MAG: hypothetical protein WC661_04120 [Opitutaceae bacterium]|jgi:flagellar motility protein MotE (MotC chaperone)
MKALTSPAVIITATVLLSAGPMLAMIWKESSKMVDEAAARQIALNEAARPEKPWDFWTPEVESLARELGEQRATFSRHEADLAVREKRLADEALELEKIRRQVETMRTEIATRLVEVQTQEVRNLKTLSATYGRLKPSAAVAIFGEMDDITVAKLLSLMKPEVTSAILEELSSTPGTDNANLKRAAEISRRLRLMMPAKPGP